MAFNDTLQNFSEVTSKVKEARARKIESIKSRISDKVRIAIPDGAGWVSIDIPQFSLEDIKKYLTEKGYRSSNSVTSASDPLEEINLKIYLT